MTQQPEREAFTYSPQDGESGHCFAAQVWDAEGKNVAVVDGANAEEATYRARIIAEALNLQARARLGKGGAKPVEVGELDLAQALYTQFKESSRNIRSFDDGWVIYDGQFNVIKLAQAILSRYNVSSKE